MEAFNYRGHRFCPTKEPRRGRSPARPRPRAADEPPHVPRGSRPRSPRSGNRVVCIDLLGHGDSDRAARPEPLLDDGVRAPDRGAARPPRRRPGGGRRHLAGGQRPRSSSASPTRTGPVAPSSSRCPSSRTRWSPSPIAFTPVLVGARLCAPLLGVLRAAGARRIPRKPTTSSTSPSTGSAATRAAPTRVLQGLLLARTCPPRAERAAIEVPAAVVGHPSDPIHPFSDSDELAPPRCPTGG